MRILPICNQSNSNYKTQKNSTQFKAWDREVFRTPKDAFIKELKHRNDTSFFRDGAFWNSLTYYLLYKYNQTPKVNMYNYGCSDGSEIYSFLMALISRYGIENAEKFTPISAMDYDPVAIEKAKSETYNIKSYEYTMINALTTNKADMFLDYDINETQITAFPTEILTSRVNFKVANILHDYKKIKPQNSIVMARNFWPYLKEDAITLAKKLGSQMGENSTLILGNYDIKGCEWNNINIEKHLINNGFQKSPIDLIFDKKS